MADKDPTKLIVEASSEIAKTDHARGSSTNLDAFKKEEDSGNKGFPVLKTGLDQSTSTGSVYGGRELKEADSNQEQQGSKQLKNGKGAAVAKDASNNMKERDQGKQELEFVNEEVKNNAQENEAGSKKCLVKWLEGFLELYEDWGTITEIMYKAVRLGTEVYSLYLELQFLMPETDVKTKQMIQSFDRSVRGVVKDENSVVACRIIQILETVDKETQDLKKSGIKVEGSSKTGQKVELDKNKVRLSILRLLDVFYGLEMILLHKGQPDPKILLKDLLTFLLENLNKYENQLKEVKSGIDELKASSGFVFRQEDQNACKKILQKMKKSWNQEIKSDLIRTKVKKRE